MVFWSSFAKKIKQSVSQVGFDALKNRVSQIENKYVKKDESNTLTQVNTFTNETNFKRKIEFRNPNNNNGAYLDNFDYGNENYTAFKLVKGGTNMLQIECNNTSNYVNISAPNTNNGLHISNVSNPTSNDNATNKGYVDGLYNPLNTKVDGIINGLQNGNIVNYTGPYNNSKNYSLAEATTYQDKWYVSNIDNNMGHTPSGSSDQYWELLSEPTINLNPYLTKSEASSTYATITTTNNLSTRITSNQNSINNLQSSKADRSYVDNKFYSKQKINSFNLKTLTGKITNISVPPQNLGVGNYGIIKMAFDTDINVNPVDWNEFAVIDFYFPNAVRNKTWMKPTFVNLVGNSKLGIEFFTPDANSYVNQVGTTVAVRIIKNENYIG